MMYNYFELIDQLTSAYIWLCIATGVVWLFIAIPWLNKKLQPYLGREPKI